VLWIWPQVLSYITMEAFISQTSWEKPSGMANPGLTLVCCDVIAGLIHSMEKTDLFIRVPIMNLSSPCGEKFLICVKEGRIWG